MTSQDAKRYPPVSETLGGGEAVVLRLLSTADGEALAAFYAGVPREDFRFYCPHPLDRDHALRNASLAESPTEVVLVMEGPKGRIRGYAWYRWKDAKDERSTFGICVGRDAQGAGAGRLLIRRLLEIAAEVGPPIMSLTVQKANARAFKLYGRMGFNVVKEGVRVTPPEFGFADEPEYHMEQRVRKGEAG